MHRIIAVVALAGFTWLLWAVVDAALRESLWDGVDQITATPWGQVTLIDLYLGFAFAAAWIIAIERRRALGIFLALLLPFLGNLVLLGYVAWRGFTSRDVSEALLGRSSAASHAGSSTSSASMISA